MKKININRKLKLIFSILIDEIAKRINYEEYATRLQLGASPREEAIFKRKEWTSYLKHKLHLNLNVLITF